MACKAVSQLGVTCRTALLLTRSVVYLTDMTFMDMIMLPLAAMVASDAAEQLLAASLPYSIHYTVTHAPLYVIA